MRYTKRLKNLRIDNDLAQKDVANILNISQSTYSQYERGKYMLPLETLKISVFFIMFRQIIFWALRMSRRHCRKNKKLRFFCDI